jgi:hypothetical protein
LMTSSRIQARTSAERKTMRPRASVTKASGSPGGGPDHREGEPPRGGLRPPLGQRPALREGGHEVLVIGQALDGGDGPVERGHRPGARQILGGRHERLLSPISGQGFRRVRPASRQGGLSPPWPGPAMWQTSRLRRRPDGDAPSWCPDPVPLEPPPEPAERGDAVETARNHPARRACLANRWVLGQGAAAARTLRLPDVRPSRSSTALDGPCRGGSGRPRRRCGGILVLDMERRSFPSPAEGDASPTAPPGITRCGCVRSAFGRTSSTGSAALTVPPLPEVGVGPCPTGSHDLPTTCPESSQRTGRDRSPSTGGAPLKLPD